MGESRFWASTGSRITWSGRPRRRPATVLVLTGVLAAALSACGANPPGASSPDVVPAEGHRQDVVQAHREPKQPRPLVAYATERGIVVADARGRRLTTLPRKLGGFSLGGDLVTVVRPAKDWLRTVAHDAVTGERRFRIEHTLQTPTVLRNGSAVAFGGQGERDRYATSLWLRGGSGRERRLIRFSFGGSPGVPTGMSEGSVLEYSFSEKADVVAVTGGDDLVEFDYDIWTVDLTAGSRLRLTTGRSSRYPAMSPDGKRVAYFREDRTCGGPLPHYRSGDLGVVGVDGTRRRLLHDGGCDRYLTRPRWLSPDVLVAVEHTRRPGQDPDPLYDSRLVLVDVASRTVSAPISETDRVGDISVSPSARRIAYNDWTAPEGFWIYHWRPDAPGSARVEPWAEGSSTYVEKGWAPHLRNDPTVIHAY